MKSTTKVCTELRWIKIEITIGLGNGLGESVLHLTI
jgi:hypothetical protein